MNKKLIVIFSVLLLINCTSDKMLDSGNGTNDNRIDLRVVDSKRSGINFKNTIVESNQVNHLKFEYAFIGAGVAVGDINNDGLEDLYFSANQGENKLYLNKGDLVFEDVTANAGVAAKEGWKTGVNMVDVNRDGFLDLYVCRSGWKDINSELRKNLLYINKGDMTFVESAKSYGLDDFGHSIHSSFFDFDKDGDLDCYVTAHPSINKLTLEQQRAFRRNSPKEAEDRLYENVGGKYIDISGKAGVRNYSHSLGVITADLNGDDLVDIYITNDYKMPDFMYINQGDGTFRDETQMKLRHMSFFSMGLDIADINDDGLEDIFVSEMSPVDYKRSKTNMASMNVPEFERMQKLGLHNQYMHNTLQINRKNLVYSEIAQLANVNKSDWSWGCLLEDLDHDGIRDLYVANGIRRDFMNQDGLNRTKEIVKENGGKLDLVTYNEQFESFKPKNAIFKGKKNYAFENVSESASNLPATNSQSVAMADLDNDGDLDVVINNQDDMATLLENKSLGGNYLQVELVPNAPGGHLNAKVEVETTSGKKFFEVKNVRGYQAKSSDIVYFGLGEENSIVKVSVRWLTGKTTVVNKPNPNQKLVVSQKGAKTIERIEPEPIFRFEYHDLVQPSYVSQELEFDDYANQILLPHRYSRMGPFMSKGDANEDGIEDLFVGGSRGFIGRLYLGNAQGLYLEKDVPAFRQDVGFEEMSSAFVDFDGDGDQDLYIVSGGNEVPAGSPYYYDRLFENDGNGNYTLTVGVIPKISSSGSIVKVSDIDGDGDLDLFVGGRILPDTYPATATSILLVNDGGTYTDEAVSQGEGLSMAGLISDAEFSDIDGDGDEDLILVGEWMGITVFENKSGIFAKSDKNQEMTNVTKGWWQSIEAIDADNDGDQDYVVGNRGLNSKFSATVDKPLYVYADDFDKSGTYDMFLAKKIDGDRVVPVRGRECSSQQMPSISTEFKTFEEFADADLDDMINTTEVVTKFEINQLASIMLINENGILTPKVLPVEVQMSEVNDIVTIDLNDDGYQDIVVAGNKYDTEAETSSTDASIGTICINDGKGNFTSQPDWKSNLLIGGNVKDMLLMGDNIVITRNMSKLSAVKFLK